MDDVTGVIDLRRSADSDAEHPSALIPYGVIRDGTLRESLLRLADAVVERGFEGVLQRAAASLLMREPPRAGQTQGAELRKPGEDTLTTARRLAIALEDSALPVQGPPGSGKTFTGARMILNLLRDGKRVGVTANSHKVISNLLDAVAEAAREEDYDLIGIQLCPAHEGASDEKITKARTWKRVFNALSKRKVSLAAGTVWLWARGELTESVDVLVVDESGQLSLANALAAAPAAKQIILLGDPQQLDQPTQGVHPPGADASVLEHLARGATTLPGNRGLFLDRTWRLHPDICAYTSEVFYEGRLEPKEGEGLEHQSILGNRALKGHGLRLVPVEHEGNSNESPEEVAAVRSLVTGLLDGAATWTDRQEEVRDVSLEDILIVAPYNAHVGALQAALPRDARVGTVDRFQGQEAPVVIYSPATSSASDAPRGMEFLFSPNRLNVATSRARCLAVIVGSPTLFTADCSSVRQMKLGRV